MFNVDIAVSSLILDSDSSVFFTVVTILFFLYISYIKDKEAFEKSLELDNPVNSMGRIKNMLFRHYVKLLGLIIIIFVIFLKYDSLVPVTDPMTSLVGVKQRIAVYEKLYDYKQNVPPYWEVYERKRGGFLSYVFEWYKKPTSTEIVYLKEYLVKVFDCYDRLLKDKKICSKNYGKHFFDNVILMEALDVMRPVNYMLKKSNINSDNNNSESEEINDTIGRVLEYYFACPNNKSTDKSQ